MISGRGKYVDKIKNRKNKDYSINNRYIDSNLINKYNNSNNYKSSQEN